eukprot:12406116-Karenia_brevis.AAC.1
MQQSPLNRLALGKAFSACDEGGMAQLSSVRDLDTDLSSLTAFALHHFADRGFHIYCSATFLLLWPLSRILFRPWLWSRCSYSDHSSPWAFVLCMRCHGVGHDTLWCSSLLGLLPSAFAGPCFRLVVHRVVGVWCRSGPAPSFVLISHM